MKNGNRQNEKDIPRVDEEYSGETVVVRGEDEHGKFTDTFRYPDPDPSTRTIN